MRLWIGLVGAVIEAWGEVRIHKTRVLLSLIGVGVAVAALTTVVAGGAIATQATTESFERGGGRPATLFINAYNPMTGETPDQAAMDAAFDAAVERYSVDYASRVSWGALSVQFADGVAMVDTQAVDRGYGAMHRIEVEHGRWFSEQDERLFAPALVVSEEVWHRIGAPDLRTHPTLEIVGRTQTTIGVIVGVIPAQSPDGSYLRAYVLSSDSGLIAQDPSGFGPPPSYEMWVPPEIWMELADLVRRDIAGALGAGYEVMVDRQDYLAWEQGDPLLVLKLSVTGIAVLVLLLGALGLLNIALVTVRHRIREIGIRRSFGATGARVFVAVLFESVVATAVAGAAGVILSVLLVKNPITESFIADAVQDVPAFPLEAAVVGMAAAVGVGALAGILPALIAVRVKVIDALRY